MNINLRTLILEILDVNGKSITVSNYLSKGLKVEFNVRRYPTNTGAGFNTAQIKVYNLSEDTFNFIADTASKCLLRCGYNEYANTIFVGNITSVTRTKNYTDVITDIYCVTNYSDNAPDSIVNEAFINISLNDLLVSIAKQMKLTASIEKLSDKLFNYTILDEPKKALQRLSLKFNFDWKIDNDTLVVTKKDNTKPKFKFTPDSGLLKPPVRTDAGVNIEIFLNPDIAPSDIFELSSKFASYNLAGIEFVERVRGGGFSDKREVNSKNYIGSYKVLELIHEGNTHDNTWFTKIIGHRI